MVFKAMTDTDRRELDELHDDLVIMEVNLRRVLQRLPANALLREPCERLWEDIRHLSLSFGEFYERYPEADYDEMRRAKILCAAEKELASG
jgi:hypothetical protein